MRHALKQQHHTTMKGATDTDLKPNAFGRFFSDLGYGEMGIQASEARQFRRQPALTITQQRRSI